MDHANHDERGIIHMKGTLRLKNFYKKSLAMELIRMGHDLHHTMKNRDNPKYQVYVIVETPELIRDMVSISKRDRETRCNVLKSS